MTARSGRRRLWYDSTGGTRVQGWLVQAAGLRSAAEVSAHPAHPRRPALDVRRRVQLLVPEFRGQRLPGAVHQPARQHGLRHRVRQRHRRRVSERGLRRSDGGRGRGRSRAATSIRRACTSPASAAAACSSSWIIGHNNRFAAAAVRAPVIDWISFAGNTDITAWGYARFDRRSGRTRRSGSTTRRSCT